MSSLVSSFSRRAFAACLSLSLLASTLPAQTPSSAEGPNWRVEVRGAGEKAAVFAVPKADPSRAVKLLETPAVATTKVYLSPTDDILLVRSGSASLGFRLTVFGLTEGTEYLEETAWNVNEQFAKARAKALKETVPAKPRSVEFVAWSGDGQSALLRSGEGAAVWYAVVDFIKNQIGGTLEPLNRRPKADR